MQEPYKKIITVHTVYPFCNLGLMCQIPICMINLSLLAVSEGRYTVINHNKLGDY